MDLLGSDDAQFWLRNVPLFSAGCISHGTGCSSGHLHLAIIGACARKQRKFLLGLGDNGAAGLLILSANVLAIVGSCLPTEECAHDSCKWKKLPVLQMMSSRFSRPNFADKINMRFGPEALCVSHRLLEEGACIHFTGFAAVAPLRFYTRQKDDRIRWHSPICLA